MSTMDTELKLWEAALRGDMKWCNHCQLVFAKDDPHWKVWKRKDYPDRLRYVCTKHRRKATTKANHKEEAKERKADWFQNNRPPKGSHYKARYGITIEDVKEMIHNQMGICKICSKQLDKFHVDHCHITGKVRGLLCPTCNVGLGLFKDNPESLRNAANYLEET